MNYQESGYYPPQEPSKAVIERKSPKDKIKNTIIALLTILAFSLAVTQKPNDDLSKFLQKCQHVGNEQGETWLECQENDVIVDLVDLSNPTIVREMTNQEYEEYKAQLKENAEKPVYSEA